MVVLFVMALMTSTCFSTQVADVAEADSVSRFNRAVECLKSGEYRKALTLFNGLNSPDSESAISYYRGICFYQLGDYGDGVVSLRNLNPEDSLYPLASFYMAETMLALHNPQAARKYLENSLAGDSSYAPARLEYIRTLCAIDSFRIAEQFVKGADNEDEVLTLAQGLVEAKKYEEAYPFLALVTARDSTNTLAGLLLGETYFQSQKYAYAEKVYFRMLSAFGASPFVLHRLTLCYGNMDGRENLEKAINLMHRYMAVSRDTTGDDLGRIGTWYYQLADYDSAESYFRLAIANDFSDPQARLNLGLALMRLGKYDDAIKSMSLAYALSKGSMGFSLSILKSLAAAELRAKGYSRAIRNYRLILEIDPADGEAVYGLGLGYDQSGDTAKAVYWYRKFVSMEASPAVNEDFVKYARLRLESLGVRKRN